MKNTITAIALLSAPSLFAGGLKVCDFENYAIGDKVEMWNIFGDSHHSSATVEADPANPSNKVLHVMLSDWNTFPELPIPTELAGADLTTRYETVEVDVYRSAKDENDWKQFRIFLGADEILDVDGYPHQGDKKVWQHRSYKVHAPADGNSSRTLHIGMHSDKSDYYIDNIVLKGKYDDYATVDGGVINICEKNTSSSYTTYTTPIFVMKDSPLTVYTARYSEFNAPVVGDGDISMYCGGERTFLGTQNGSAYPDWSEYTGNLHIYPYKEVEASAGNYGLVLNHGGKRFNPEDIAGSLDVTNSMLVNNEVTVHDGATLGMPTGVRGARIGHLTLLPGSRLIGPMKTSSSNASYFVVGADGADALLEGRLAPLDKGGAPDASTILGLVKEGKGTYRLTGNTNLITGAVRVLEGSVLANNDAAAAAQGRLAGAIGAIGAGKPGVYVFEGATFGGIGSVASVVDLYGTLAPGDNGIGTLTLADYAGGSEVGLRLRPTSKLKFEISSSGDYDRLVATGACDLYNICQDFQKSDDTPVLYLLPTEGNSIQAGDSFTLITASAKTALETQAWTMRVQYPKQYTWLVEEIEDADGYRVVATVTSLEYSGQGDTLIDGGNEGSGDDEDDDDGFDETTDPTPLRDYAETLGMKIGVAASVWKVNVDDESLYETGLMAKEFNLLVAENEMKFENTEPSRNSFSYGEADRLVRFAERHGMEVRGHALAWHKQCPAWLSSDGGVKNNNNFSRAELLGILRNHIEHVVGHYKGRVAEWDVVNECLSDDQSVIRTDPEGYTLRQSVFYTGIGEEFIDSAFVWAHRVDPDARLILNEYGGEFLGQAKTEALFNLAKRLKESGVPIHGVGLQCHLDAGAVDAAKLNATIDKYEEIGLYVVITELDLGIDAKNADEYEKQAKDYRAITKVAATNDNCRALVVWGLADDYSWRSSWPLLYDSAHKAKPAYYGVHAALRRAASVVSVTDIEAEEARTVSVEYYDLGGRRMASPHGFVIEVRRLSDGSVRCAKRLVGALPACPLTGF